MANNRAVLVCNVCHPSDWDYAPPRSGIFVISKFYPTTGHYPNFDVDKLYKWMDDHRHLGESDLPDHDEYPFRLEYETPQDGS